MPSKNKKTPGPGAAWSAPKQVASGLNTDSKHPLASDWIAFVSDSPPGGFGSGESGFTDWFTSEEQLKIELKSLENTWPDASPDWKGTFENFAQAPMISVRNNAGNSSNRWMILKRTHPPLFPKTFGTTSVPGSMSRSGIGSTDGLLLLDSPRSIALPSGGFPETSALIPANALVPLTLLPASDGGRLPELPVGSPPSTGSRQSRFFASPSQGTADDGFQTGSLRARQRLGWA
jgi:hypothetical protein